MFDTIIVQPIFNLLVLIYALIPGHNFGLAIILFTIVIRLLMWPLVKKQLHHAKKMRELQPEIKKIKQATKGNRQKEQLMVMELYKERGINPFSSLGLIIVQLPIFIALFSGLNRIINDPNNLINFSYPFVRSLQTMQELAANIELFDNTLFGVVDLSRAAISGGQIYLPALLIVLGSAVAQYYQSKQLMPDTKDSKSLRQILKDAQEGKQADQSEMTAATGRFTRYMIPGLILVFTIGFAAALPLYWLTSSLVALIQQRRILSQDETEMEQMAGSKSGKSGVRVIEGEVINPPKTKTKTSTKTRSGKKRKKRR
jgi:YidC/Oxa1 family membrane protein insertase